MFDILQYTFFQNALWAVLLIGIAGGIIGTYIVTRRMVFITGGITHASFGGLGIGLYLGISPTLGALLFAVGSALGVGWLALYTASLLLLSGLFYRSLIAVAFDRDFAFTRRLPVRLIDYTMVVMVSLCVVLTIRLVGIMLLLSMLTIPQMTVELFTRHYRTILWGSGLLTVAGGVSGLWLAYLLDVPSGACIVFLLIAVYAVARCGLKVYRRCAVRNP